MTEKASKQPSSEGDGLGGGGDELMTPEEASRWLKISLVTLWRKTAKREIPFLLFGVTIRYSRAMIIEKGKENALNRKSRAQSLQGEKPEGGEE